VRDYFTAVKFDPLDLTQTNAALFMTRWITHYCAPIFVFLAGVSAYLSGRRMSRGELSRFLVTRGLWLIVLELTVLRTTIWFTVDFSFLAMLQVIWAIGASMIVLGLLVHLPVTLIAAIGVAMIAGHNAFDGVRVPGWGGPGSPAPDALSQLWIYLHQPGMLMPIFDGGPIVFLMYPLIPWIGVMAAGFAFGQVFELDAERRRRVLISLGTACVAAFVVLRVLNGYGDPAPWSRQSSSAFTVLSFINTTKYPPSLLYLLMTLGPGLLALAWLEQTQSRGPIGRAFVTFGRVPMFFYLWQWPLAHGAAILLGLAAGKSVAHLFTNPPEFFNEPPPGTGFSLPVVYATWVVVVLILYVLCRWFAGVKQRRRDWWIRYL
jgi:uncharacterized membrane protein